MDIAEFLTAQLDAEQRLAEAAQGRYAGGEPWGPTWAYDREHFRVVVDGQPRPAAKDTHDVDGEHIAYWDPARVLADIAAKRRIVAEHGRIWLHNQWVAGADGHRTLQTVPICRTCGAEGMRIGFGEDVRTCPTLKLLAAPYADRPGYNDAWRIDG